LNRCGERVRSIVDPLAAVILFYPVGDEDVRIALSFAVAIRGEDDLLSIGTEHRESVKGIVIRDAFKAAAINVN
jgi:hypothetical protein